MILLKALKDWGDKIKTSVMATVSGMLNPNTMEILQKFIKETNIYLS